MYIMLCLAYTIPAYASDTISDTAKTLLLLSCQAMSLYACVCIFHAMAVYNSLLSAYAVSGAKILLQFVTILLKQCLCMPVYTFAMAWLCVYNSLLLLVSKPCYRSFHSMQSFETFYSCTLQGPVLVLRSI